MKDTYFDPAVTGFSSFRRGFPREGRKSIFSLRPEIVTDGKGRIVGVTNPEKLLFAHIPSSAEGIALYEVGENAFSLCTSLRRIVLPEGVEWIGSGAFAETESLEEAVLPGSVMEIGEGLFRKSGIKSFVFPKGIREVPAKMFCDASRLSSVSMPPSLLALGRLSFAGTASLRSIDLGFRITEIPDGCFLSSGIESVSIPRSVRRIGAAAFSSCRSLGAIWYDGSADDFRRISFASGWNRGMRKETKLFVKDHEGLWIDAFSHECGKGGSARKEDVGDGRRKALETLGLSAMPESAALLSRAFREKAKAFHPDTIAGLGLSEEYTQFAQKMFGEIHDAYIYLLSEMEEK